VAHISAKDICEHLGYDILEKQIYNLDKSKDKSTYRKLASVSIKDAKATLTKRELEDYWLPRKILKYEIDLKIR
jgi:hypothetical protein